MSILSTLVLLLAGVGALGHIFQGSERTVERYLTFPCGNKFDSKQISRDEAQFATDRKPGNWQGWARTLDAPETTLSLALHTGVPTATVDVYFHVISANGTEDGGDVPDYVLGKQIEILNNAFRDAGLVFDIAATSRTVNRDWWQHLTVEGNLQYTMKYETRRGGVSDLNVWIVGTIIDNAGQEVGGHGTLPQYYASHPDDDGVIIQEGTLPGGYMQNFNEGVNLVHQVGHWVGLYHTFEGGCAAPGDYVNDTPSQAWASTGACPIGQDTCAEVGIDPIHNYMDYTADSCRNEFTRGQITRLKDQLRTYRGINI